MCHYVLEDKVPGEKKTAPETPFAAQKAGVFRIEGVVTMAKNKLGANS